jgi:hypothetical protein
MFIRAMMLGERDEVTDECMRDRRFRVLGHRGWCSHSAPANWSVWNTQNPPGTGTYALTPLDAFGPPLTIASTFGMMLAAGSAHCAGARPDAPSTGSVPTAIAEIERHQPGLRLTR